MSTELQLSSLTQFKTYGLGVPTSVNGMVTIKAPTIPRNDDERSGVDLVCAIDVSGSMRGDKLRLVKLTLHYMIDILKEKDNLGIVSFHTTFHEEMGLTSMNNEGKKKAHAVVDSLFPKGSTNISGGLSQSIETLLARKTENIVRSIILLTDGHANVGLRDADSICKRIDELKKKHNENGMSAFTLHTFGFGSDHTVETLQTLAERNGGMYSYIQNNDLVGEVFANTLGGLISCVASDVKLILEATDDTKIVNIRTGFQKETIDEGKKYAISLVDLQEEERRDILFELEILKESKEEDPDFLILKSELVYKDVTEESNPTRSVRHLTFANRVATPDANQEGNSDYMRELYRLEKVEALDKASLLADKGHYNEAQHLFKEMKKKFRVHFQGDELSEMDQEIDQLMDNFTTTTFASVGKYRAYASRSANAWQRSAGLRGDVSSKYTNKKKEAVMSKFSFF